MDQDGHILDFNPAAERMFGRRREDVLGLEVGATIVPVSLRARHFKGLARYKRTGRATVLGRRIELSGVHADGTEFPLEIAITRVDQGTDHVFTAYLRDLTERELAEGRMKRLALALEQTADISPAMQCVSRSRSRSTKPSTTTRPSAPQRRSRGASTVIAVDDAGARFASFRHILELRPAIVKLDRSLVAGIDADPTRQALVAGLRHFVDTASIRLIAEGIETEAEVRALLDLGVSTGQGYLLGRPGPL